MTDGPITRKLYIPVNICGVISQVYTILLTVMALATIGAVLPASANSRGPEICDAAARLAARQTGVPVSVLRAISLTETGRKKGTEFAPWPWTVNMEGKGDWFESRELAIEYTNRHHRTGARSFDVGCFQLNYKWHGHAFASIEEMFEPNANALYAARFLRDLYNEKGNWSDAAGAYHSRNPEFSDRYRKRFDRILSQLDQYVPVVPDQLASSTDSLASVENTGDAAPTLNTFPLLQGGSAAMASLGSLMPESAGIGALALFGGG